MRFTFAAVVGMLAATVAASAIPVSEPVSPAKREAFPDPAMTPNSQGAEIVKRGGNWINCEKRSLGGCWWNYKMWTYGDWDDDWGNGYLDNLRGQCPDNIEGWGFWYDENNTKLGGHASFAVKNCDDNCILDAAWLASQPTGPIWGASCQYK
ncbi:hypothetical protein H072_8415 [Dactylellina haptotyla CBS 200.50]|uniref:Secreted protein n=1 Tax=Dactylellina haptotyla (strain CBS 200.50) TaxID=1284197 RepID=S8AA12_DACHA|nr:hypothetical protein H072_8415 [Dactylellina haptotyla CBS 200.50]